MEENDIEIKVKELIDNINSEETSDLDKSLFMIKLGDITQNIEWYNKSFLTYTNSISQIKLSDIFSELKDYQKSICYLKSALELNDNIDTYDIYKKLYFLYWYNNDIENSKKYYDICISMCKIDNLEESVLNDYRYYYDLPKISIIGDYNFELIYPEEKILNIKNIDNIMTEYVIYSENIKDKKSIMIEYLKKINNINSNLLYHLDIKSEYKVIYVE